MFLFLCVEWWVGGWVGGVGGYGMKFWASEILIFHILFSFSHVFLHIFSLLLVARGRKGGALE